ncbi:MAG: putative sulfate exporter family transporter [Actinobacteria bacterium]|nr:putative sulfate exporter family transporter [Propionicimonas sp.]MBU3976921.1 putative sulfate exporter family transporter [Actinomycetota bacterium]MBU3986666.1 putative sulfate exporter family transporter [Actinomycetota bacterium]MBU4007182.1 putative sulfate exporter family transporter [Actinomycetota bacterium]MBU4064935.1 putative sulfate exporter family transporter [Actinomycetota bacterium]
MTQPALVESEPISDPPWWPGLLLSFVGAGLAIAINLAAPGVSAMLVAILLGAVLANLSAVSGAMMTLLRPGLAIASRRLLRVGVVLLGLQLVLGDILALGWPIVVGVAAIVGGTMAITMVLGRVLKVGATQTLLIAGGFSICGAAAVAGIDGVLAKRKDSEAATAVALVVAFGTVMIAVMPVLSGLLGLDARTAGIWTGASTHEVAQVVAAAGIIGPDALKVAVVVKLARVLMLAPVLALVSWRQRAASVVGTGTRPPLVPLFVVGFVAMVALRSFGVVPAPLVAAGQISQAWLLGAAMFALGTSVHWSVLKKAGRRPLVLAAAATAVVMVIGGAVALLGR